MNEYEILYIPSGTYLRYFSTVGQSLKCNTTAGDLFNQDLISLNKEIDDIIKMSSNPFFKDSADRDWDDCYEWAIFNEHPRLGQIALTQSVLLCQMLGLLSRKSKRF